MARLGLGVAVALALAASTAAPAQAAPACPGAAAPRTILSGQGVLESVIADPRGRLYYTDTDKDAVMMLAAPGAPPQVAAEGIAKPGGMLLEPDGTLIVGQGDGFQEGAVGNIAPGSALVRVNPDTHTVTPYVKGVAMGNGLARGLDGAIYASDDAGLWIDRIDGTTVTNRWAQVISSNGLAVDREGKWLYAAQTFQPAAIRRISIADPTDVRYYAQPEVTDVAAGLDGMTIDQSDRLFVAANGGGQIWRVDTDRAVCTLATGLLMPSAVGFGAGGAFPATSLYAVTFSGNVVELPNARPDPGRTPSGAPAFPPPARLRFAYAPKRVRAGRTVRLRVRVERALASRRSPVADATVRVHGPRARARATTDRAGRATLRWRPRRAGRARITVSAPGFAPVRSAIRVLPPR